MGSSCFQPKKFLISFSPTLSLTPRLLMFPFRSCQDLVPLGIQVRTAHSPTVATGAYVVQFCFPTIIPVDTSCFFLIICTSFLLFIISVFRFFFIVRAWTSFGLGQPVFEGPDFIVHFPCQSYLKRYNIYRKVWIHKR